jgi:hypothetical protein
VDILTPEAFSASHHIEIDTMFGRSAILLRARANIPRATRVAVRSYVVFLVACVSLGCCDSITLAGSFGIRGGKFHGG